MFKVHINDGSALPDDDVYYIVAKEGIFLKKKLGVMESIAPVKNISKIKEDNFVFSSSVLEINNEKVAPRDAAYPP